MLLIKLLLLTLGGSTIAGVTYTQTQKTTVEKTVIVANNQESKIRSRLENDLNTSVLTTKKGFLEERQKTAESHLKNKTDELNTAKQNLTSAYNALNRSKNELNVKSELLVQKYSELKTKDNDLKNSLTTRMTYLLNENTRKLKNEFFAAQKATYNKEKEAIVAKIKAIDPTNSCAISSDVCTCNKSFSLNTTNPKTPEETTIESNIKTELSKICNGLNANTNRNVYTHALTDDSSYDSKKSDRDAVVETIRTTTNEYNLQIITIKSAESEVQMKLLQFQHASKAYEDAKTNNEKLKNEIEILSEEIKNIK